MLRLQRLRLPAEQPGYSAMSAPAHLHILDIDHSTCGVSIDLLNALQ
jgi:hypothetical protein